MTGRRNHLAVVGDEFVPERAAPTPAPSTATVFDDDGTWMPPEGYRATLAAAELLARKLANLSCRAGGRGELLLPTNEVEFLACRLHRLVGDAHSGIPEDVS